MLNFAVSSIFFPSNNWFKRYRVDENETKIYLKILQTIKRTKIKLYNFCAYCQFARKSFTMTKKHGIVYELSRMCIC